MRAARVLAAAALAACLAAPAAGSDPPEQPEPTAFERLFPEPTGRNGYEEIVAAGDLARQAESEAPLVRPTHLGHYHRLLAHPACRQALRLLRAGLRKPVLNPPIEPGGDLFSPEHAGVRALARLLGAEQQVALSEGRVWDAIRSMEDGAHLADAVRGETLLEGLVSIAVESIGMSRVVRNRDSWTVKDCDRLIAFAKSRLAQPDPFPASLEGERRHMAAAVRRIATASPAELRAMEGIPPEEASPPELDALTAGLRSLQGDPARLASLAADVEARLNADIDTALASVADPRKARSESYAEPTGGASLADRIAQRFLPVYGKSAVKFAQSRVNLNLLAAHAAIRRYQWEHDGALPESLTDTELSRGLLTDPFTGDPLHYRRTGENAYELWSAGALRGDGSGKRDRITLPWTKPPE